MLVRFAGATVIELKVITVKAAAGLFISDWVAVTQAIPAATPLTTPFESIVAMALSDIAQVTWDDISLVEPSA